MAGKATQENKEVDKVVHFWTRESASLYLFNEDRKVRFNDYHVTLDLSDPLHKEVCDFMREHRAFNVDFFEVITQKNTREQQKFMLAWIRGMLTPPQGERDDVAVVSGVKKLAALFSDEELKSLETSRSNPDIDLLTMEASQNKYIQGVE